MAEVLKPTWDSTYNSQLRRPKENYDRQGDLTAEVSVLIWRLQGHDRDAGSVALWLAGGCLFAALSSPGPLCIHISLLLSDNQ